MTCAVINKRIYKTFIYKQTILQYVLDVKRISRNQNKLNTATGKPAAALNFIYSFISSLFALSARRKFLRIPAVRFFRRLLCGSC